MTPALTTAPTGSATVVRRLLYIVAARAYTDLRTQAWMQA